MYSLHHHHNHNPSVNYSSASDVISSTSSSSASLSPVIQENMQQLVSSVNYQSLLLSSSLAFQDHHHRVPIFGSDPLISSSSSANCNSVATAAAATTTLTHEHRQTKTTDHIHPEEEDTTMSMSMQKAEIAAHPRYPSLLQAYIECQKVGAPTEVANMLDDIRRHHQDNIHGYFCSKQQQQQHRNGLFSASRIGQDPELDNFMETYCDILMKYRMDLSRSFDEATNFLNKIELQLSHLSNSNSSKSNQHHPAPPSSISTNPTCLSSDHEAGGGGSSEDEMSGGEMEIHHHNHQIVHQTTDRVEDRDLKDKLLRKYSGYISCLKQEFLKKKKKGKLPKEARQTLLNWWDIHNRWPYPTEVDKIALAEATNLDQKQINNWFINQRKRHWKPSENMRFSVMDNLSTPFYIQN
ncbi:hypothetical protein MKX01_040632 [Papaver californicum]|nr:hypothetical protein MKX01_040632 [Papaver californicum]